MATDAGTDMRPLWQLIEERILASAPGDFEVSNKEGTIQRLARELDETGHNVSLSGGPMIQLRAAVDARIKIGRPLLEDLNGATAALTLDDVVDAYAATLKIVRDVGTTWPRLKEFERRADVRKMVDEAKLDLMVARAKGMPDDRGIRTLIADGVADVVIIERLGIDQAKLDGVHAAIAAEQAAIARVKELLAAVEGKPDQERIKHLIDNDVEDALIVELAGVDQAAVDGVKKAMEAELAEKKRLAEEEAAKKKAEAEGPPLEDIPDDEKLEHIESIREILEFSDQEAEIRTMCEQSSIPKCLVDIAVAGADKLDEIEKAAGG